MRVHAAMVMAIVMGVCYIGMRVADLFLVTLTIVTTVAQFSREVLTLAAKVPHVMGAPPMMIA